MVINRKRTAVEVAFTQEYSKGIEIHGERVWTIKESGSSRDNKNMVGEGREDSRMDWTKDKVRSNSNAYFGRRLPPGLPGRSGLQLYDVPEHGGLLRTDRAVTTCRLSLHSVEHAAIKGNI